MNTFTKDEQYKIIDMYENGVDIDKIINEFNSCERDIRIVLKDNNIDRQYNTFSKELYDRIIKLYLEKCTQQKICYDLLISECGIRKTLDRNGIQRRSYSENNRRYSLDEYYFDNIDTPSKAYILGLLFADGCNHTSSYSITLHLQEEDYAVIEFVKNELQYEGPIRFNELNKKNPKHKNAYILCINDEYMSKKLEEIGMVNAKSLVLKFPECVPEHLYSSFTLGYYDGDGCIYYDEKRNKCQTQTVGTSQFCKKISEILYGFGCKNNIKHPKQCNENTVVLETCGNKSSLLFLSWMYQNAPFCMKRKYQKYLYFKEKYLSKK